MRTSCLAAFGALILALPSAGCTGVGVNVEASGNPLLVGLAERVTRPLAGKCPGTPSTVTVETESQHRARYSYGGREVHRADLRRDSTCSYGAIVYNAQPVSLSGPSQ
jgi:hypothetical protein